MLALVQQKCLGIKFTFFIQIMGLFYHARIYNKKVGSFMYISQIWYYIEGKHGSMAINAKFFKLKKQFQGHRLKNFSLGGDPESGHITNEYREACKTQFFWTQSWKILKGKLSLAPCRLWPWTVSWIIMHIIVCMCLYAMFIYVYKYTHHSHMILYKFPMYICAVYRNIYIHSHILYKAPMYIYVLCS